MAKPTVQKMASLLPSSPRISIVVVALISVLLTTVLWGIFYFSILREKLKLRQYVLSQLAHRENILLRLNHPGKYDSLAAKSSLNQTNGFNPEQAIPNTTDISELLNAISSEASLAGLVLMNFEEKKERSLGLLTEIPILLTLTGQYENLIQFIIALDKLARLTAIQNMHLTVFSSAENHATLTITLTLTTYRGQVS